MQLGINAAFAIKRWPEPSHWLAIVQEDLALNLVQFSTDQLNPHPLTRTVLATARRVRQEAERRGVTIHSVQIGLAFYTYNGLLDPDPDLREASVQWCLDAVALSAEVGASGFGGPLGAFSVADVEDPRRKTFLAEWELEAVGRIGERARELGLQFLLWEPTPLVREIPSTIAETRHFLERANEASPVPVLLCLDLGHACRPGAVGEDADPYSWVRRLGARAAVLHAQQTDGKGDRHWPFTPEFNSRGIITPEALERAMAEGGCEQTPVILEIFHPFEAPDSQVLTDLRTTVDFWKAFGKGPALSGSSIA